VVDDHLGGINRRSLLGHDLDDALHGRGHAFRWGRTAALAPVEEAATCAISLAYSSGANVLVSGRPPAREITSGRSVSAIISRIAELFIPRVARGKQTLVARKLVRCRPGSPPVAYPFAGSVHSPVASVRRGADRARPGR